MCVVRLLLSKWTAEGEDWGSTAKNAGQMDGSMANENVINRMVLPERILAQCVQNQLF